MDKLLFFLCCIVLAATPVQGSGLDAQQRPPGLRIPEDGKGQVRIPIGKPRSEREGAATGAASTGASAPQRRGGTDLGYEAEKEEEDFLKKRRVAPVRTK